jgi:hypothetical protein
LKDARAPALVVLGATGSLGRAVCAAAERLMPSVRVVRAARRARGEGAVSVDVRDPLALGAVLRAADVAICAVGPFEWDPRDAIRASVAAKCHWIDLADRARFLAAAEQAAEGAGDVAVASGCSVVPGLVEAVAAAAAGPPGSVSLRAWWSIGSRKAVSGALLYALLRPLGRRAPGSSLPVEATIRRAIAGVPFWFARHPWPRGGEAQVDGRRLPIELRVGMDHPAQAAALRALSPILGRIPEPVLLRAARALQPATHAIQRLGGARGALAIESLDASGRKLAAVEILSRNGLELAALPPVWAARALLAPSARAAGATSLAALVPPAALAAAMRAEEWIVTGF